MSAMPRLRVSDPNGPRLVPVDKPVFTIGRRTSADLQLTGPAVSRDHARIVLEDGRYLISDCGSRFGTFLNDVQLTDARALAQGDRIRLGRTEGVELVFLLDEAEGTTATMLLPLSGSSPDLPQMAAILNGLRAMGSGRVLDEVLTLVLDSALDVTSAERGFVMLATPAGALEFKVGREKGRRPVAGDSFATSGKIPREVFETGQRRFVADLLDGSLADAHGGTIAMGIRHVLCVPLQVTAHVSADRVEHRTIGVLYLDSRERAAMLSSSTQASLEAFATQAALAIDSARLYAESAEKTKLERDLRIAAEIQQELLPDARHRGATYEVAAASLPCRTVGGDFYDYLEVDDEAFGFTLGDVAGKGPPAALLATAVQSNFSAHAPVASGPADLMTRLNRALLRRAIGARFATMCYGVLGPKGALQVLERRTGAAARDWRRRDPGVARRGRPRPRLARRSRLRGREARARARRPRGVLQ